MSLITMGSTFSGFLSRIARSAILPVTSEPLPLIGAHTRTQLRESLGALQVALSAAEVARIEEAIPAAAVAGTRYDEHQMRVLDSER